MATPEKSRRKVLKGMLGASIAAFTAPVLYVSGKYLGYVKTANPNATVTIPVNDVSKEHPSKIIDIEDVPVIVVLEEEKGIRAFTAKCTHLGCTVSYVPEQPGFFCKCHRGKFDLDGVNVPGTRPKKPLTELMVTQIGDELTVSIKPKKNA